MAVGIICEYNPFHNGHLYHLNRIKKLYPKDIIIVVMSSNFTQRGELSLIDKWDKVDISLYYGVDLVVELPFKYATQSADFFAMGAINILKNLKVDKLVFGSESNDINMLTNIAREQLNNKKMDILVKKYLKQGYNYPSSLNKAIKEVINIEVKDPNDLLGLSYIKEIIKQDANIVPISIQRTNDYHSKKLSKICSATAIREAYRNDEDINKYIPNYCQKYIKKTYIDDYFIFIKHQILTNKDLTIYQGVDTDLHYRLKKYINTVSNLEDYLLKLKTKRYTYNRLKRLMVHILVGYTKEDNELNYNYIRVLGFNKKGREYLHKIKKVVAIPIITNYSNSQGLLDLEYQVNSIIYMTRKNYNELLQKEKQELIIR